MGREIERKFLVNNNAYKSLAEGVLYYQGFLSTSKERVVRIRIVNEDAFLTIKGSSAGAKRTEFEYKIPVEEARIMLDEMCEKPIIIKHRYKVEVGNMVWEVDEFLEENKGLVIAEVELQDEYQELKLPKWVGKEVTNDPRYYNANLIKHPFNNWK